MLNPLETVKSLMLDCDFQARFSLTTQITMLIVIIMASVRQCPVSSAERGDLPLHAEEELSTHNCPGVPPLQLDLCPPGISVLKS